MSIYDLRDKIDCLDAMLVKLLAERVRLVLQVAEFKRVTGEVEDCDREIAIFENVKKLSNEFKVDVGFLVKIYEIIVSDSKALQQKSIKSTNGKE